MTSILGHNYSINSHVEHISIDATQLVIVSGLLVILVIAYMIITLSWLACVVSLL